MDTALLEQIGMTLGVGGLIAFMFFIIFAYIFLCINQQEIFS